MTIAACYVSTEGVVLGADSTSTIPLVHGNQLHLEHVQKVFEIGTEGTLGLVLWGIGQVGDKPYRTMAAELSDVIDSGAVNSFEGDQRRLEFPPSDN